MRLILTLTNNKNRISDQENRFVFDQHGGSIGRTQNNDCVLPDPDLFISRKHAVITYEDGTYYLTDTSENGVFLNQSDKKLGKNNSVELSDGDFLNLGEYELRVSIEQSNDDDISRQRYEDPEATTFGPQASPWEISESRKPSPDILDGRSLDSEVPSYIRSDRNESNRKQPKHYATEPDHSPVDQDYFIPPSMRQHSIPEVSDPATYESIPEENSSISDWDHTEIDIIKKRDKKSPPAWDSTQIEAGPESLGQAEPKTAEGHPGTSKLTSEDSHHTMKGVGEEAISLGVSSGPAPAICETDLVQAFFDGVGLDKAQLSPEAAAALMKQIGMHYRIIVQGVMEILMARFDLKNEFRMRHTQLQLKENNPLKFPGQVDDALEYMLLKQNAGFLPPETAFKEAFQDIRDHQLAMVVGMRSAFESLLERFDPEHMEKQFMKDNKIANILSLSRKSMCWERYKDWYADISVDVQDEFQKLFGDAFTRAYEEQVARLSSSHKTRR